METITNDIPDDKGGEGLKAVFGSDELMDIEGNPISVKKKSELLEEIKINGICYFNKDSMGNIIGVSVKYPFGDKPTETFL